VGKYNVSFICRRIGNVFERQMAYLPANYAGKYKFFRQNQVICQVFIATESFLFLFGKGECRIGVNRQQGTYMYDNGKALPRVYRELVLDLHHQGFLQREISQTMRVSVGYVNKVAQFYEDSVSGWATKNTRCC